MSYYFFQREERIQNYIAKKNGTPHGTFLVPPDVDAHTDYSKRSFFVFKSEEDHGAQTRLVRYYFLRQYNVMIYDKIYLKTILVNLIGCWTAAKDMIPSCTEMIELMQNHVVFTSTMKNENGPFLGTG